MPGYESFVAASGHVLQQRCTTGVLDQLVQREQAGHQAQPVALPKHNFCLDYAHDMAVNGIGALVFHETLFCTLALQTLPEFPGLEAQPRIAHEQGLAAALTSSAMQLLVLAQVLIPITISLLLCS